MEVSMDNKDWHKKGTEFWNVVQDAINSGDYSDLSQHVRETITDTVEGVTKEVSRGLKEGFGSGNAQTTNSTNNGFRNGYTQSQWKWSNPGTTRYSSQTRKESNQKLPARYVKHPPGFVSGIVMSAIGYPIGGGALIGALVLLLFGTLRRIGLVIAIPSLMLILMGIIGTKKISFISRFKKYIRIIGDREYCTLDEFISKTGKTKDKVLKDLKKMINRNLFLHGYIDSKETCIIVTERMYQQYMETEKQAQVRAEEQRLLEQKQAQLPEDCRKILEEGREYISFIHFCNDELPGEEISQKLDKLEVIITRIFKEVEQKPQLASDLRRFMNYYLPTTRKLLQAYCDVEKEPIISEDMTKTKIEIENTINTINHAFENLLNSFFADKALDISSDISVLNTMLAQEGLTKKDFL